MIDKYFGFLKNNAIDKDEILFLVLLENKKKIEVQTIFDKYPYLQITQENLKKLEELKLITINYQHNLISLPVSDNGSSNLEKITVEFIDEIRTIINREIKPYELEKLKSFLQYGKKAIIDAFLKAKLKDIDNFTYVEKILQNNFKNKEEKQKKNKPVIERNFDFFS